jgi:hypothetical protein
LTAFVPFTGIASFAQERIFLDEQIRFSSHIAIYNELVVLRVAHGSLSMTRLATALRSVLARHQAFRTALIYSNDQGCLRQRITNRHETFTMDLDQSFSDEVELQHLIHQATINPALFDLSTGRVFHAHILRHRISMSNTINDDLIATADVLVIAFHHAMFDRSTFSFFSEDLCSAYNTVAVQWLVDDDLLQYIDYSVHERLIDMTPSHEFWKKQLERYNAERRLSLPTDRQRSPTDRQSGLASTAHISLDDSISQSFVDYAAAHSLTLFQLGLATFYVFLFRLTDRQTDLCVSCLSANRYKTELQRIGGMFVSTLPYRLRLDARWTFDELAHCVREQCLSIMEHAHYPLQHILADCHVNQSNASFLEMAFDLVTVASHTDQLSVDGAGLEGVSLTMLQEVAKFDFQLTFLFDATANENKLSFDLTCSCSLFDETTIAIVARRFEHLLEQLFSFKAPTKQINASVTAISKLDLILAEEAGEMESLVFSRQSSIIDEGMFLLFFLKGRDHKGT